MTKPNSRQPKSKQKPEPKSKLRTRVKQNVRKARTAHAKRKLTKLNSIEAMLAPTFKTHFRSTTQEVIAGVVLGIFILIFVLAMVFVGIPSIRALIWGEAVSGNTTTAVQKTGPVVAQQEFLMLTLDEWHYSQGGKIFKAAPGYRYVVMRVKIIHTQPSPKWLAPALQSYIIDSSGQQYTLTPDDEFTDPFPAHEYKPGQTAKGALSYEVPVTSRHLQWCYDMGTATTTLSPLCIPLQ